MRRALVLLAVVIGLPSCLGPIETPGTPAGEHAPTDARRAVRDTVRVRFVGTAPRRTWDRALHAVVEVQYRVEGDSVRVRVPTDSLHPAEAWLDGKPLAGEAGRVASDSLRPYGLDPAERAAQHARADSARAANGLPPAGPATWGEPVDVLAFGAALDGPARLRVVYAVETTSADVRDSPHADHDVVLDWADGVAGPPAVLAEAPEPWAASVVVTERGVRVEARRSWSRANRTLFDVWPWIVLALVLAASAWAGVRLGRALGRRPEGGEAPSETWAIRLASGVGLVVVAVVIGIAAGVLAALLVPAAVVGGDSAVFTSGVRLTALGVGVLAGLGSAVVVLVGGGVAWRRATRS